ncbi:10086_t:CDS:2, partial [Gigaspora rosea]
QENTSLNRIATYRHEYDEFVHYKFKVFISVDNQHMINKIERNKIILVIGRFVLENSELNITDLQAINLDLKTIENEPTVYDLPVTPPGYNPITSNYLIIEINCAFDTGTARHSSVLSAIENKAIISVCGELYKVNKASTSEQATNNRKKRNQDLLNFKNKCKNKKIDKKAEQTPMAEPANNKPDYEDPINRLNNESEEKS